MAFWETNVGAAPESVDFFQPTTQPTTCDVLYDFRVFWQSPRSCKLSLRASGVLMTLDLDFANVQADPPKSHPGIVVFRPESQDKPTLVALLKRLVLVSMQLSPKHQLWTVEPDCIPYREE